jgi:hypothetical protein
MALTFLNEVWATRLLMDLAAESVYKQRGNQNYQVDASNAKRVHIGKMTADISISDYAKNTDISDPQILTDEDTVLTMDQQKYFNFYVDDIAKAQTTPSFMSEAMRKSAIAIAQTIDSHVSSRLITGTIANNMLDVTIGDTDSVAEKGTALLTIMSDLKTAMRVANISKSITPWAVLSPAYMDILEKYFLLEGKSGVFLPGTSEQVLRSGFMGNLLGIDIFWSNRAPQSANSGALKDIIISGTIDAFTYADNVTEVIAYRPEKRFGDAVKGLYVYGTKVTENKQLFTITNDGTA